MVVDSCQGFCKVKDDQFNLLVPGDYFPYSICFHIQKQLILHVLAIDL